MIASRQLGRSVADHRSSWVREVQCERGSAFLKTYEYASWADRCRDFGKRTAPWGRPRAVAEFDALTWLRSHGLPAPAPLAVWVWRRWGLLARATLVTTAFPGAPADRLLPQLGPGERRDLARAIGRLVGRLHSLGFRDRNLDLRNLLVARDRGEFVVAKIDSPRFRVRAAGRTDDALARADWARLLPQLAPWGVDGDARAAATAG